VGGKAGAGKGSSSRGRQQGMCLTRLEAAVAMTCNDIAAIDL